MANTPTPQQTINAVSQGIPAQIIESPGLGIWQQMKQYDPGEAGWIRDGQNNRYRLDSPEGVTVTANAAFRALLVVEELSSQMGEMVKAAQTHPALKNDPVFADAFARLKINAAQTIAAYSVSLILLAEAGTRIKIYPNITTDLMRKKGRPGALGKAQRTPDGKTSFVFQTSEDWRTYASILQQSLPALQGSPVTGTITIMARSIAPEPMHGMGFGAKEAVAAIGIGLVAVSSIVAGAAAVAAGAAFATTIGVVLVVGVLVGVAVMGMYREMASSELLARQNEAAIARQEELAKEKAQWRKVVADPNSTPAQKAAAREALGDIDKEMEAKHNNPDVAPPAGANPFGDTLRYIGYAAAAMAGLYLLSFMPRSRNPAQLPTDYKQLTDDD
jgi:hypothetical protein